MRVLLLIIIASVAAVQAVAATPAYDLAPGYYAKFNLHYKVHYTWHGDSLEESGSIEFDTSEGHVVIATVLGDDEVDLVVLLNGAQEWATTLDTQPGTCFLGCDTRGTVTLEVNEDCDGTIRVVYGGDVVASLAGDPSHAITINEDGRAELVSHGAWVKCQAKPSDIAVYNYAHSGLSKVAMVAIGVAIALVALAIMAARG